jgi:glycerophosphoryl diester phosphodiesterase
MKRQFLLLAISMTVVISCEKNNVTPPLDNPDANLLKTLPISDTVMHNMEGIYELTDGSGDLGTEFVCKVSKSSVSFFSNSGGIYIILKYGLNPKNNTIEFAGFWRYSENTVQGLINLSLTAEEGGSDLLKSGVVRLLMMSGTFTGGNGSQQSISINFKRAFSQYTIDHEFMIFAHHGVQTTANPPYTENSLNGVIHDQEYGVNGLEFDVHLTRDHIPICAHDADIELRVTEKGPLSGEYIQYDFAFLDSSVRLSDGEKIASVEQVLNAFIDSTTLKYMWLDIKGDPNIFNYLEPIVRNAYKKAAEVNRKIVIITDLTSDVVVSEYLSCPSYISLPTMSELGLDDAILHNCIYWGPRYSQGLLLDEVDKAHSLGMKVLSWTLNDKNLILDYLVKGKFDGFISDYPSYVIYDFYTLF